MGSLVVLLEGRTAGVLTEDEAGQLRFAYDHDWLTSDDATPLSVSMPLTAQPYGDAVVRPFVCGLLPDDELVHERWARAYGVSRRSPFALLRHVGEDCAGGVRFVGRERAPDLLAGLCGVDWLTDDEAAGRLQTLRVDPTAWHPTRSRFTLAGAQAKTALYFDDEGGRWGMPYGAWPTTHILKLAVNGCGDHYLNEHLCLDAARRLGLPAARSWVESYGGVRALVVERFDRSRTGDGRTLRIHQEDTCQAVGLPPTAKYQNEGGPLPERIAGLLGPGAQLAFIDALALNWLVGGTDAHAKNYSLLLSGGQVRLAPLYDVASALPHDESQVRKLKMAMKVGGEYRLVRVQARHWARLANALGLTPDTVVDRVHGMAVRLPEELAAAASSPPVQALGRDLPDRLVDGVTAWAAGCRVQLE